jgi:hypothetical protein
MALADIGAPDRCAGVRAQGRFRLVTDYFAAIT